jgi:hypothetical protein
MAFLIEVMGRFDLGAKGWLPMTEAFGHVEHHALHRDVLGRRRACSPRSLEIVREERHSRTNKRWQRQIVLQGLSITFVVGAFFGVECGSGSIFKECPRNQGLSKTFFVKINARQVSTDRAR